MDVFYDKNDVKNHMKAPAMEFLFLAKLQAWALLKHGNVIYIGNIIKEGLITQIFPL